MNYYIKGRIKRLNPFKKRVWAADENGTHCNVCGEPAVTKTFEDEKTHEKVEAPYITWHCPWCGCRMVR